MLKIKPYAVYIGKRLSALPAVVLPSRLDSTSPRGTYSLDCLLYSHRSDTPKTLWMTQDSRHSTPGKPRAGKTLLNIPASNS